MRNIQCGVSGMYSFMNLIGNIVVMERGVGSIFHVIVKRIGSVTLGACQFP